MVMGTIVDINILGNRLFKQRTRFVCLTDRDKSRGDIDLVFRTERDVIICKYRIAEFREVLILGPLSSLEYS